MLIILRIVITGTLIYVFREMHAHGAIANISGDLTQAFFMSIVLVLAILLAVVWVPFLGEKIADPLTGELISGSFANHRRWLPRLIRWAKTHRYRRLTLFCSILEGLNNPDFPMPFTHSLGRATFLQPHY
ncbi:MAG: hypothetical protein M2R45_00418 [Verrucomicrobia subdivision 3 bacterium]|nr:hypothetical protein [Limisphaerales bacterium]MCS1413702.1 hypothetical protein [Limisphaerales bacterium]